MPVTRVTYEIQDKKGKVGTFSCYVNGAVIDPTNTDVQHIKTALLDVTDGKMIGIQLEAIDSTDKNSLGTVATDLDTISDKLCVELLAGTKRFTYQFPCPRDDIWLDDGITLDSADVDVADFLTKLIAVAKSTAGGDLTFSKGYRTKTTRK